MSDRCGHGVLLDAMSCSDCIAEENDQLQERVEKASLFMKIAKTWLGKLPDRQFEEWLEFERNARAALVGETKEMRDGSKS